MDTELELKTGTLRGLPTDGRDFTGCILAKMRSGNIRCSSYQPIPKPVGADRQLLSPIPMALADTSPSYPVSRSSPIYQAVVRLARGDTPKSVAKALGMTLHVVGQIKGKRTISAINAWRHYEGRNSHRNGR